MRALELAREASLNLVEVSPTAQPPVCRLLDYGKYKYEQTRKERDARKNQKTQALKEMRLTPKIGEHDLVFKTNVIQSFLKDGDKVKVTVRFKGRENAHPELGRAVLEEVAKRLGAEGSVERAPIGVRVTGRAGRLGPPAPGGFFAGFSLGFTFSLQPSIAVPCMAAIAAAAARSVAMSTKP